MKKNAGKGSFVAPRNGHVAIIMTRGGGGAHGKTRKSERQAEKASLRQAIKASSHPEGQAGPLDEMTS